jgi:antitoxin component YwqK of YwqJK toxin-antitoxin module
MNPNNPKNVNSPPTTKPLRNIINYYYNSNIKYRECNRNENNQYHGLYESWYFNGQIEMRCSYQNGFIHGLYESWYPGGQIEMRCSYRNGLLHGLYESWRSGGSIRSRCYYNNGDEI